MSGVAALSLFSEGFVSKKNSILKWLLSKQLSKDWFVGHFAQDLLWHRSACPFRLVNHVGGRTDIKQTNSGTTTQVCKDSEAVVWELTSLPIYTNLPICLPPSLSLTATSHPPKKHDCHCILQNLSTCNMVDVHQEMTKSTITWVYVKTTLF